MSPPSIIVPDSPNGSLFRVSLDGQAATPLPLATPLMRPTSAFVLPDATMLNVDENGGTLVLRQSGTLRMLLAGLNLPDDVVADAQGASRLLEVWL